MGPLLLFPSHAAPCQTAPPSHDQDRVWHPTSVKAPYLCSSLTTRARVYVYPSPLLNSKLFQGPVLRIILSLPPRTVQQERFNNDPVGCTFGTERTIVCGLTSAFLWIAMWSRILESTSTPCCIVLCFAAFCRQCLLQIRGLWQPWG